MGVRLGPVAQSAEDEFDVFVTLDATPLAYDEEVGTVETVLRSERDDIRLRGDREVLIDAERNDVRTFAARRRF